MAWLLHFELCSGASHLLAVLQLEIESIPKHTVVSNTECCYTNHMLKHTELIILQYEVGPGSESPQVACMIVGLL